MGAGHVGRGPGLALSLQGGSLLVHPPGIPPSVGRYLPFLFNKQFVDTNTWHPVFVKVPEIKISVFLVTYILSVLGSAPWPWAP